MIFDSPSKSSKKFAFHKDNRQKAEAEIKKYPKTRQASAVLALLWLAQKQSGGWLPNAAIHYVADFLKMPAIRVFEIVSFYSMFNQKPVGKYFVQICGTTPCWLRGADGLKDICRRHIGEEGELSSDDFFTWREVECLGACVDAPIVQINDDYHENLDPDSLAELLEGLKKKSDDKKKDKDTI